jgi:hypothetical protein
MQASFKKEARFFFETKRSVSLCGFQNGLAGKDLKLLKFPGSNMAC